VFHHGDVQLRILRRSGPGPAELLDVSLVPDPPAEGWLWADIELDEAADLANLQRVLGPASLDPLAVRDALEDDDLPKFDDFEDHLLLVLRGLRLDEVETYEIDCFLADGLLVTIHHGHSPSTAALQASCLSNPAAATGGPDEMLARLAAILTRRLMTVVDAFEDRIDGLVDTALAADPLLLENLTAVRSDVASVRRVVHPQREALDATRRSEHPLIGVGGRRRFADAFDVAVRAGHGLEAARTALSETLDAYRGAEARRATEVSRVLTVYAAIMLPLSLIAGFFGMNFANLPLLGSRWGWVIVTAVMAGVAALSLGMFVSVGWMRRPSGTVTRRTLGRGLVEAARTPVVLVGSMFELPSVGQRPPRHPPPIAGDPTTPHPDASHGPMSQDR
jgi:magnesium transporter